MESINVRNKTIVMSIRAASIIYYPFCVRKMAAEDIQNSAGSVVRLTVSLDLCSVTWGGRRQRKRQKAMGQIFKRSLAGV